MVGRMVSFPFNGPNERAHPLKMKAHELTRFDSAHALPAHSSGARLPEIEPRAVCGPHWWPAQSGGKLPHEKDRIFL